MVMLNFTIFQGESKRLRVPVTDFTVTPPAPFSLVGTTINWSACVKGSEATAIIPKDNGGVGGITVSGVNNDTIEVFITEANTLALAGTYQHQCQVKKGTDAVVVFAGTMTILAGNAARS